MEFYKNFFKIYKRLVKRLIIKETEVILKGAKDYYENNKELLSEREQKIDTENYLKKKKK